MIGTTPVAGGIGMVTLSAAKLYTANATLTSTLRKVSFRSILPSVRITLLSLIGH
ncbi:MAG: hypothetical protein WDN75_19090 [Bacteroidota bacterium]